MKSIVGRGVLSPLFYEDPTIFPTLPVLPCCLQSVCTPTDQSVVFFLWLNRWLRHICVLFYSMISWMYTCRALGPWCIFMQQAVKFTEVWHMMFFLFVLWYDITHAYTHIHTQRHTAHPGASRLTHPYKYIFIPTVMCSQQLSLLHWMKKSLVSKIFLPQSFLFKNYSLENHICRLDAIILIEMVWINKTHTRAHQTLRER